MDVLRETQIGSFPKDLRVIINRFTYNESGRVKLLSSVDFPRVRPRPTINFGICIRIDQTDALFHNGILEARSIKALLNLGHLLQIALIHIMPRGW